MMIKILVHKAGAVGAAKVPDLLIEAIHEFPDVITLAESRDLHVQDAEQIVDALLATLPGGTIDQVLLGLLEHQASLFRIPYRAHAEENQHDQTPCADNR